MSIPPSAAIGAALAAARLTAGVAANVVEGSAKMAGQAAEKFADVFSASNSPDSIEEPVAISVTDEPSQASAIESLRSLICGVMDRLGLSIQEPTSVRLDDYGQIQVAGVSLVSSPHASMVDASQRMQLQATLNADTSLRDQVAELLAGQPDRSVRLSS